MPRDFRELAVWQKGKTLVREVYKITSTFPPEEKFGLTMQLRRAAVSVPSNIAEGQGRGSTGEFRQFLGHARGSLCEVVTQLEVAAELGFVRADEVQPALLLADELLRMLNGLRRSLGDVSTVREDANEDYA